MLRLAMMTKLNYLSGTPIIAKSKNVEAVDERYHPQDVCGDGEPEADDGPRAEDEAHHGGPLPLVET